MMNEIVRRFFGSARSSTVPKGTRSPDNSVSVDYDAETLVRYEKSLPQLAARQTKLRQQKVEWEGRLDANIAQIRARKRHLDATGVSATRDPTIFNLMKFNKEINEHVVRVDMTITAIERALLNFDMIRVSRMSVDVFREVTRIMKEHLAAIETESPEDVIEEYTDVVASVHEVDQELQRINDVGAVRYDKRALMSDIDMLCAPDSDSGRIVLPRVAERPPTRAANPRAPPPRQAVADAGAVPPGHQSPAPVASYI